MEKNEIIIIISSISILVFRCFRIESDQHKR